MNRLRFQLYHELYEHSRMGRNTRLRRATFHATAALAISLRFDVLALALRSNREAHGRHVNRIGLRIHERA